MAELLPLTGTVARPTLGVLGGAWVCDDAGDREPLKPATSKLLGGLIAHGKQGASAEVLAKIIWPGKEPQSGSVGSVRMAVTRLRQKLPAGEIVSVGGRYSLKGASDAIDINCLVSLADDGQMDVTAEHLEWALAGRPFDGIDLPQTKEQLFYTAAQAQRDVVRRFCRSSPETLDSQTAGALESFVISQPFEEDLLEAVGACLVRAGKASVVEQLRTRVTQSRLDDEDADEETVGEITFGEADHPPALREELARLLGDRLIGRQQVMDGLRSRKQSLLVGPSGSGKTRLLAELGQQEIERGAWVTYLSADTSGAAVPYGPFLMALPELRHALGTSSSPAGRAQDGPDTNRAERSRIWGLTLALFEQRATTSVGHHLLVDDAHELDQDSLALLRLLMKTETVVDLRYTIAGIDHGPKSDWISLKAEFQDPTLGVESVAGLDLESLQLLVWHAHPDSRLEAQRGLAEELLATTGGLPAFAIPLLKRSDPETLLLPERSQDAGEQSRLLVGLSPDARMVGGTAAVLGQRFLFETLCAMVALPEPQVLAVLDRLLDEGMLTESQQEPAMLQFSHIVMRDAFLEDLPNFRRRELHRAALEFVEDIHETARHKAGADVLIDRSEALAALRESAAAYSIDRQWRRVISQLRLCQVIGGSLHSEDLVLYATALDRSGADGSGLRTKAYRAAVERGDDETALRAALSGLPESERSDGDHVRLELLRDIKPAGLAEPLQFLHAVQLCRQETLAGNSQRASESADHAINLADTADDRAEAHLAKWTARYHTVPGNLPLPEDLDAGASQGLVVRLAQLRAIAEFEAGRLEQAIASHKHFERLANGFGDPLREWHAMGHGAMLEFNAGRLTKSEELSQRAYEHGQFHGLHEATAARAGQVFSHFYVKGQHGLMIEGMRKILPDIERSPMANAAFAASLLKSDDQQDREEAISRAIDLTVEALDRVTYSSVPIVGLMTEVLGKAGPEVATLASAAREFLETFGDAWILVGFGVTNLGPIWRCLAHLAETPDEKAANMERAVASADRFGSPTWRVVTRLDLAGLYGQPEPIAEARELVVEAELPDLTELIDIRTQASSY